jgi:hypothetical protein
MLLITLTVASDNDNVKKCRTAQYNLQKILLSPFHLGRSCQFRSTFYYIYNFLVVSTDYMRHYIVMSHTSVSVRHRVNKNSMSMMHDLKQWGIKDAIRG